MFTGKNNSTASLKKSTDMSARFSNYDNDLLVERFHLLKFMNKCLWLGPKYICWFRCPKSKFLVEFILQMTLGEVESTSNSSFLQSLNLSREELDQCV